VLWLSNVDLAVDYVFSKSKECILPNKDLVNKSLFQRFDYFGC
jgi:hypothetical protein